MKTKTYYFQLKHNLSVKSGTRKIAPPPPPKKKITPNPNSKPTPKPNPGENILGAIV